MPEDLTWDLEADVVVLGSGGADSSGRVIGVIAEDATGKDVRVRARCGVVIATGGFEWNEALVKAFLRGPMTGPVSVPENEGDGLIMAIEAGAQLGNMQNAWWQQSVLETKPQHRAAKPNLMLGTAGGPKTNENAQVLDWQGNVIPGLYTAGNAMAAVMGEAYGGAGGTLGPGLTFGYIAGKHLGAHLPNV